ncbi:PadR family transcriptional regulator [Nocardioides sp. Bht2]|uniref:PadR family transcriptional regulator n=1 Tax=Nocardioides sp. Bht2 TaxID=3392297 RepID=UPI0039B59F63
MNNFSEFNEFTGPRRRRGPGRGPGPHPGDAHRGGPGEHGEHGHGGRRGRGPGHDAGFDFGAGFGGAFGPVGPPPWLSELFGAPRPRGRGRGGRPGPKVRRGDVRAAILDVLRSSEQPINGYQVIGQIAERSGDAWRPSPGSVYPTIQQLQDEGLIDLDEGAGRRALRLTEEGVAWCAEHEAELAAVWAPFDAEPEQPADEFASAKAQVGQVISAVWQIAATGSAAQRHAAVEVLSDARRRLYGILADGDEATQQD